MPELSLYILHPRSAFHLGQHGIGQEQTAIYAPADTLFAALLTAWVELGGDPQIWSQPFPRDDAPGKPPFLLSSAFPFAGKLRFYPMPQADLSRLGIEADERRKDLRRIAFVSEGIFRRVVEGQSLTGYLPPPQGQGDPEQGLLLQEGQLWLSTQELPQLPHALRTYRNERRQEEARPFYALARTKVWVADKVPRVTIDRRTRASNIFHTGRLTFNPGCGLWFGVAWLRPDKPPPGQNLSYQEIFEQALSVLADSGLGGERAAGYGAFRWEHGGSVHWLDPASEEPYVTLSRYHPRSDETPAAFTGDPVAYSLAAVAGYLQAPGQAAQRRRRLWLAAEGSVLRAAASPPFGDLSDVRPKVGDFPHPIWRYGLACPVKLEVPHGE